MYALSSPLFGNGFAFAAVILHHLSMPARQPLSEARCAALIEAIAASADRGAFIALFEFFAPRIKSQAMRFGLEASAAEDVAQDAMLAVWRNAGQFDSARGSASAWVFAIAVNARVDRLRRDRSLATSVELDESEPMLSTNAQEGGPDAARLQDVIAALPAQQRQIVQLSFYRDMPHAAIAARLGLPLGTVKSRMRLALNKLRQALRERP